MKSSVYSNFRAISSFIFLQLLCVAALFGRADRVPYHVEAPLIQHLSSINQEWDKQQDIPASLLTLSMKFNSDNERIQLHLQLVNDILKKRSCYVLSLQQFVNRKKNLESLMTYWETGQFPVNTRHTHRQPYFIDDFGTACAVGHLLLTSGQEALAHQISKVQNYAYVHELNYPELSQWAVKNGFTKDELAWIQPVYPGHVCYFTDQIPDSTSTLEFDAANTPIDQQEIRTIMTMPDASMALMGGNILITDGGTGVQSAGIFGQTNTGEHVSFGNAIQGTVYDIEYHNGQIYAAGDFVLAGTNFYNLAYWDGTNWIGIQTGNMNGIIRDIVSYECQLYAGGDFTMLNGTGVANFAVWNGINWATVPQNCSGQSTMLALEFNGPINTFEIFNGKLAIGGDFTSVLTNALQVVEGLVFWDNLNIEFLPLNGQLTSVNNLESYASALIVGGDSLYAYRWNKWYHPGDSIEQHDPALSYLFQFDMYTYQLNDYYTWELPFIGQTNDIFYDPLSNPPDIQDMNHLIISTNNEAFGINSYRGQPFSLFPNIYGTTYHIIANGPILALGQLPRKTLFGGNFTTITIDNDVPINYDNCIDNFNVNKAFELVRYFWTTLPIELSDFTVKATKQQTALLEWTSLTEENSAQYIIERRTDDDTDFARVGQIAAAGTSTSRLDYSFEDDISQLSGHVYYRLKMVDQDENFEYSDIRSLKLNPIPSELFIAPNPADRTIELSMDMPMNGGNVTVTIYNLQGQPLKSQQYKTNEDFFRKQIDVSQLENGLYLVEVVSPNERKTKKIEIIR